jgi:gliding motility-associated-like protein
MRKVLFIFCLAILSIFLARVGQAQIVVNAVNPTTLPLDTLIRRLVGPGVSISNISANIGQNNQAYGSFRDTSVTSVMGIRRGLLMTTGNINLAVGPNTCPTCIGQTGNPAPGGAPDPQLAAIATGTTNDVLTIQFNFVPFGDTIKFNYVFGSEEYPNFSCTNFNDVFGFFVSGPNPNGGNYVFQNIARVPNTTIPVAINNVTNGGCNLTCPANQAFFIPNFISGGNCTGGALNTGYDGFTTRLEAVIPVVRCQTYTLKLAIADVSDNILDSFVIIEEGSFQSTNAIVEAQSTYERFDFAIEGCNPGEFKFKRVRPDTAALTIAWEIRGSATNGLDYTDSAGQPIKKFIVIPGGQDSVSLKVFPVLDSISDPLERMVLRLYTPCDDTASNNPRGDSVVLDIREEFVYETASDIDVCGQDSIRINPVPYLSSDSVIWSPPTGLSCVNCLTPLAFPPSNTTYQLTVFDSITGCRGSDSVRVLVYNPVVPPAPRVCPGTSISLSASGAPVPVTYQWFPHPSILTNRNSQTVGIITGSDPHTYIIRVTYPLGCVRFDSIFLPVSTAPRVRSLDTALCFGDTLQLDFRNTFTDTIIWENNALSRFILNRTTLQPSIFVDSSGIFVFRGTAKNDTCETPFNVTLRVQEDLFTAIRINLLDSNNAIIREVSVAELQSLPLPYRLEFDQVRTNTNRVRFYWDITQQGGVVLVDSSDQDRLVYDFISGGAYTVSLSKFLVKGTRPGDTCTRSESLNLILQPGIPANVITPNGDKKNDTFVLKIFSFTSTFSLKVYNRWGREVYASDNYQDDWAADNVEGGVYFYSAKQEPEGKSINGWLQVIK